MFLFCFITVMSDAEKKKYEEEQEALREKRKKHEPVNIC